MKKHAAWRELVQKDFIGEGYISKRNDTTYKNIESTVLKCRNLFM